MGDVIILGIFIPIYFLAGFAGGFSFVKNISEISKCKLGIIPIFLIFMIMFFLVISQPRLNIISIFFWIGLIVGVLMGIPQKWEEMEKATRKIEVDLSKKWEEEKKTKEIVKNCVASLRQRETLSS